MPVKDLNRMFDNCPTEPPAGWRDVPPPPLLRKSHNADIEWIGSHLETLQREHANQWIAVLEGKVVAVDAHFHALRSKFVDASAEGTPVYWFMEPA